MEDLVASLYRRESRRIFSTLVRLLGSFDLAEDALHDAFLAASEQWPSAGVPANPVAWLVSTGRFRAIDRLRRDRRLVPLDEQAQDEAAFVDPSPGWEDCDARDGIEDDRLRLVFTCCHPSLSEEARVGLTLREVCGLTTEAIASAFLVGTPALAQRIVRAKAKIAAARIPYEVPGPAERPARLRSVLRVVYLVFTEGQGAHAASLADEAVRLARLLHGLLPDEPEVTGLLALLVLHDARRAARTSAEGELVPLEEQDRSAWNRDAIVEGCALAHAALSTRGFGAYALQAAIAALHAEAPVASATDWAQIVGLYDALLRVEPSAVVALNRAVAVGMRDGPEAGLALVEPLLRVLPGYHAAPAAAADLCRRAGRVREAAAHYRAAIALTRQWPERRVLERRLAALGT